MVMEPPTITAQQQKTRVVNGKPIRYDPPELTAAKAKLESHLAGHIPNRKFEGPIQLVVKWCFPLTGNHENGEWKTTKPDTDNLQKALKDVMTKLGFWKDDALVASEITQKFWATLPGIWIQIEELEESK